MDRGEKKLQRKLSLISSSRWHFLCRTTQNHFTKLLHSQLFVLCSQSIHTLYPTHFSRRWFVRLDLICDYFPHSTISALSKNQNPSLFYYWKLIFALLCCVLKKNSSVNLNGIRFFEARFYGYNYVAVVICVRSYMSSSTTISDEMLSSMHCMNFNVPGTRMKWVAYDAKTNNEPALRGPKTNQQKKTAHQWHRVPQICRNTS